jgi:hypothetical protein
MIKEDKQSSQYQLQYPTKALASNKINEGNNNSKAYII